MTPELKVLFGPLRRFKVGDFVHRRQLPSDAVALIDALVDPFLDVRREICSQSDPSTSFLLFLYAGQVAVQSVRDQNPAVLARGLIALAIENLAFDGRDTVVALAQIYHSARRLPEVRADGLFQQLAEMSLPPFRDSLLSFVSRRIRLNKAIFQGFRCMKVFWNQHGHCTQCG